MFPRTARLRVKKQGGIVRMALAMMVQTRLWLGGEVSAQGGYLLLWVWTGTHFS